MAECSQIDFELPGFSGRKIEGNFAGGNVSIGSNRVSPLRKRSHDAKSGLRNLSATLRRIS
jgi:hypothetical protein